MAQPNRVKKEPAYVVKINIESLLTESTPQLYKNRHSNKL